MKKWPAHRSIVVGLTVAILCIAAVGVSGIVRLTLIEQKAHLIATDSMPGLKYTSTIEVYTHQKSALISRHILTDDLSEKRRLEEEIRVLEKSATALLEEYSKSTFTDIERPLYERVKATRPRYLAAVERALALSRQQSSAVEEVALQKAFEPESRDYLEALHKDTEHNQSEADDAARDIEQSTVSAQRSTTVEALTSLLLALASAMLLARGLAQTERSQRAIEGLNRELEDQVNEVTSINRELEAFTYSVSHDLRAPLRHIDGFSTILMSHAAEGMNEAGKRAVERIRFGAQQMGRMIDDLLEFSRMGRRELTKRMTSLDSVVEDSIELLRPAAQEREIEFKIGELPTLECDPALIKHVMVNLLSNAIKFTRESKPAVIEVGQIARDGAPAVFVRDNGVGFDMRYADKLFGIFQRLHRREDYDGVGIGLATVQRVVHKHGGRVWAEAEPGKGATFYFTLRQDRN